MMRIDPGDRQSSRIQAPALEWLDMIAVCWAAFQRAIGIHFDDHGRDLEQSSGRRVKPPGLYVNDDGEETSEASCHEARRRNSRSHQCCFVHLCPLHALRAPLKKPAIQFLRRQVMRSPALSGTSSSEPNG